MLLAVPVPWFLLNVPQSYLEGKAGVVSMGAGFASGLTSYGVKDVYLSGWYSRGKVSLDFGLKGVLFPEFSVDGDSFKPFLGSAFLKGRLLLTRFLFIPMRSGLLAQIGYSSFHPGNDMPSSSSTFFRYGFWSTGRAGGSSTFFFQFLTNGIFPELHMGDVFLVESLFVLVGRTWMLSSRFAFEEDSYPAGEVVASLKVPVIKGNFSSWAGLGYSFSPVFPFVFYFGLSGRPSASLSLFAGEEWKALFSLAFWR